MFTTALFKIAKILKSQVLFDGWVDKEDVVCICNGIVLATKIKKKKKYCHLLQHGKSFEKIMLSEVGQRENKKYYMISPKCGIYKT